MKCNWSFLLVIFMLILFVTTSNGVATNTYGEPLGSYVGENGLTIISYCQNWQTQQQLKTIYDELMNNTHGSEIDYLSKIYIYSSPPTNYPKGFSSFYHEDYSVNKNGQYSYGKNSYIEIYNGEQYTDISQMARILSHEYGHHFTFYYLITKENLSKENWINAEYAQVRDLKAYPQVTYLNQNPVTYSHEWDIAEILAEDYIQLYGSQLTKATRDYLDVKERISSGTINYYYVYNDFNLLPQENLDLKLAADVDGLSDYFSALTGIKPLKQAEKLVVKQPYLSAISNVFKNFNAYEWEIPQITIFESRNQYEYTLLINPSGDNDYPIPLKTVNSGESFTAITGSAIDLKRGLGILTNFEGDYQVRVFVKDKNGFMHSSVPVEITISPRDNAAIRFMDIPIEHWASDYIYDLTNRGLVEGYKDQTFHPESTITRAEFMTFLIRSIRDVDINGVDNAYHWFIEQGYRDVAVSIGLLSATDDHVSYYNGNITREEMAQMIYYMLKFSGTKVNINFKSNLTDIQNSEAYMEISIANYYKIINGYKDQTFKPINMATRAEAMKMISKYLSTIGI